MNTECPRRAMKDRELLLIFAEFLYRDPPKEDYLISLIEGLKVQTVPESSFEKPIWAFQIGYQVQEFQPFLWHA